MNHTRNHMIHMKHIQKKKHMIQIIYKTNKASVKKKKITRKIKPQVLQVKICETHHVKRLDTM